MFRPLCFEQLEGREITFDWDLSFFQPIDWGSFDWEAIGHKCGAPWQGHYHTPLAPWEIAPGLVRGRY
jgi:hypothetical protein